MIRLIKQTGTNQCSSCLRATFDGAEGDKLDHVYELDVGYKNHYISVRLCDECVRQLIAECVITLTKIDAIKS